MKYTESFYCLTHGTDKDSAEKICSKGFLIKGDSTSWCGKGVYFYDVKAKAWWAANRKCEEIKKKINKRVQPRIIIADIINMDKKDIFDLRAKNDLDEFELFVNSFLSENVHFTISGIEDETERIITLRAMLISFFVDRERRKLVIGNFKQRPQPVLEHVIEFANSLDMVFGIETIYCVKDIDIISNIRLGGNG